MNVWVSVGMRSYLSGRADPRLAVDGRYRGSDNPSSRNAWTTLRAVLWASDCGHGARAWGAHAFAGARAARGHLEPLVITRSVVSGMRSNHRSSRQCSECRRLIMPLAQQLDACGPRPGQRWLVATAVSATADRAVITLWLSLFRWLSNVRTDDTKPRATTPGHPRISSYVT